MNALFQLADRGVGCVGDDPASDEAENMDEGKGGLGQEELLMGGIDCAKFERKGRGKSEIYVELALPCSIKMGRFWERANVIM